MRIFCAAARMHHHLNKVKSYVTSYGRSLVDMDTTDWIKWRAYAAKNLFKCLIQLQKSFLIFPPHERQYTVIADKKKSGKNAIKILSLKV